MRPHLLLFPAALLLAADAGAQNMPYPPADSAPITSVQVTAAAKPQRIRQREAETISGAYEMSNGWYLRVLTSARYIDAIIDDQPPLRLVPVAPYRFVSGDGNVTMDFNHSRNDADLVMSYVPNRSLAQRIVISSRMAQR
ncbi:hypothetical protein [Massilia sp. X63]|uniref:hypothetical protein n=1 Tax=Massilia sp. X63 TaxID=3237285 RepID=UPI0034DD9BF3